MMIHISEFLVPELQVSLYRHFRNFIYIYIYIRVRVYEERKKERNP